MINNIHIPLSLFKAFSHITYYDEPHTYHINGKQLISATSFIKLFKKEFDTKGKALDYADKYELDADEVEDEWNYKREFGTTKGSLFHKYAENYHAQKIFPYESEPIVKKFGIDIIKPKYDKLVKMFHKYYADSKENLIPIKSEYIVGDAELGVCGCVDQLYFNLKSNQYEIWDYKTNKQMRNKSAYKERMKHPLTHLDVCEMNTYSLQLYLYKHIIEKNVPIKIGNCYIIWFFEENDTYKIFKCHDMRFEIEAMLEYAKKNQLLWKN